MFVVNARGELKAAFPSHPFCITTHIEYSYLHPESHGCPRATTAVGAWQYRRGSHGHPRATAAGAVGAMAVLATVAVGAVAVLVPPPPPSSPPQEPWPSS